MRSGMTNPARILVVFGTRPEAIKLFPVVNPLKADPRFESVVCVSAQHREMLDQVLNIAGIVPDHDLDVMKPDQSLDELTARLTRPSRRIMARVVGHRLHDDADGQSFAARYRFHDGLAEREVVDQVSSMARKLEIGTLVELAYPEGRPDLARPPRPLMWCTVYGGLLYGLGVLTAKALGMI